MRALGDAVAVALLERKGFSAADFQVFHPGGQLGRRLLRVSDLMHSGPSMPLIAETLLMGQAILEMTGKSLGCVGVVNAEGGLMGIITDGDLRRHLDDGLLARPARDIMTRAPKTIRPNLLAAEALRILNDNTITSLFVVEAGRPVGVLHVHDVLRAGVA
ncbi:MAG: CBS domain-containing protein, partial [Rhodospirillales bacterium]|nr:CBS domain-containing protein [Rhodospirillales bacterium]